MSKCSYVEISREIIYSEVYDCRKGAFELLFYLLLDREIETNSLEIIPKMLGRNLFNMDENTLKKKLFKLKKWGYIELYKTERPWKIIVALRKNDDLYKIGDFELFLDDDLIIQPPKSYSRNDSGYDNFRKSVLERDNFTCQLCGSKENLEVHHKKSYAKYARLRTVVSNGITLCQKCHDKVHGGEVDIVE